MLGKMLRKIGFYFPKKIVRKIDQTKICKTYFFNFIYKKINHRIKRKPSPLIKEFFNFIR